MAHFRNFLWFIRIERLDMDNENEQRANKKRNQNLVIKHLLLQRAIARWRLEVISGGRSIGRSCCGNDKVGGMYRTSTVYL